MRLHKVLLACVPVMLPVSAFGQGGTWVDGYHRDDGTYVRGHYRSNPDGIESNNYGPSEDSYDLRHPGSRDADDDGISNMNDYDSDNDGIFDNSDSDPY